MAVAPGLVQKQTQPSSAGMAAGIGNKLQGPAWWPFPRFLWILDFRAALGYAVVVLDIPAHFPEFMLELCLVGCHSCVEKSVYWNCFLYLGIIFAVLQSFCLLWFIQLLIFLLPECEDVVSTICCCYVMNLFSNSSTQTLDL